VIQDHLKVLLFHYYNNHQVLLLVPLPSPIIDVLSSHGDIEQAPVNGHKDSHDHTHDKLPQTSSSGHLTRPKGNVSFDVDAGIWSGW
jgi:hypothetical protein